MNRLKSLREKRNMKQSELGKLLNVKEAAISKYESEKVPLTADTLIKLSNIFNVSIDYILGINDNSNTVARTDFFTDSTLANQLRTLISEEPSLGLSFYAQVGHMEIETLQKYINGDSFPSSYDLCKLVEIFDTSADYLFGKSAIAHPKKRNTIISNQVDFSHRLETEIYDNYLKAELADKLNVSISKIERLIDKKEIPTPQILEHICQILQKSTDYMLGISEFSREPITDGQYPFHMDEESIKRIQTLIGENWTDYDASSLGLTHDEFYMMYYFGFIPHISVLQKICKYYHVSSDYLLNLSDSKLHIENTHNCNEENLLRNYRKLDEPYQQKVSGILAEQLLQQERDHYMRLSVAADEALKKTGTDKLGK